MQRVIIYRFNCSDNTPYEKVGNNDPVSIADEVPFEIPESWSWARLKSVCTKLVDGDHNPPKGEACKTEYIMASSTNINDDKLVELEKVRYLSESIFKKENERTSATEGDIFFTSVGSLGRSCIYDGSLNICFQRSVSVITTLIFNEYLKYCFDSGYFQNKVQKEATGTAQRGFYLNQLANALIPIPPIAEQKRIATKVKQYLPLIKDYANTQNELDELNKGFPDQLKKSILQLAVQGKLVDQDPNDEPASVLLERIRAEKERLIKEGKIKRDKNESIIYRRDNSHYEKLGKTEVCIDDEIPFEIPDSWEWVRLNTLCKSIADGDHQPPPQVPAGIPFLVISDVSSGQIDFSKTRFVPSSYYQKLSSNRVPETGDILFTVTGSYGIVVPVRTQKRFCFQRHMALLKPCIIDYSFLAMWLTTPLIYEQCRINATGTAQKTVGLSTLRNLLIPIPPMGEQVKIINKLKFLLPVLDSR